MSRNRDIATILGRTEETNTQNKFLLDTSSDVGLDSAQVTTIAEDAGLTVYSTLDSLPVSNLTSGDQAYVSGNNRLYISNGSGWYNVALINLSPTMSLDQSGTIALTAGSLSATVTITAQDSDNPEAILTYSVESDGNMLATGASVSQDSSVFTITGLSADSGGVDGSFDLTFKATDQINQASEALSFTITLSNVVDSSAETIFLMKADGNNAVNDSRTFINSGGTESSLNVGGSVSTSSLSPYRSGGYSVHFDGTGDYLDYGTVSAIGNVGTSDFTFEAWFYNEDFDQANYPTIFAINSYTNGLLVRFDHVGPGRDVDVYIANSFRTLTYTFNENEWYHMILTRESGTVKMWINGEYQSSFTGTLNGSITSGNIRIGTSNHIAAETWQGYITDVRFVNGTAEQTGTSDITVPTSRLGISGADLFTCHLPYINDAAGNADVTHNGDPRTVPFGPYDYQPWVEDDHSTSLDFNGSTIMYNTVGSAPGTGDFTYEGWVRCPDTTTGTNQYIFDTSNDGFGTGGVQFYIGSGGEFGAAVENGGVAAFFIGTTKIYYDNTWFHFAMVRNSGSLTFYVDGKVVNGPHSYTRNLYGTNIRFGASNRSTPSNYFTGEVSNFRITNSAVYTAAFTPPTTPVTTLANNQFLLNPTPNIYDAAAGNESKLVGNTKTNNSTRKFTTSSSVYFDGAGDAIELTPGYDDPRYKFGTEDFTVEMWAYWTNLTGARTIGGFIKYNNTGGRDVPYLYTSGTTLYYWTDGANRITGTSALTLNTWHHIAVTRSGNDHKLFVDGTQVGSTWTNASNYVQGRPTFGNYYDTEDTLFTGSANQFFGYLQDIRITKGYARYTANFTPPTAEFEL